MQRSSSCSNSIPFTEAWLCTSKFPRSQHRRQLGLPGYWYTRGWGLQSTKKEGSPFGMASRTNRTRTSPTASKWRLLSLSKQQSKPESAWAVSIDIRDAYLHIPMCPTVWRYLQFCINKCLPFHVSTNQAGNLSTWVHQASDAGNASVTYTRGPSTCLPGRLAHLGGFKRWWVPNWSFECCTIWDG